jgi:hypothetical protein
MIFIFIIIFLIIAILLYYKQKRHIIITLTTSPKRIKYIKPVIDSINNQTIKPNLIYINLPIIYKRTNETFTNIPDFLYANNIIINYVEDIGPITKILPTLKKQFNENTLIISIDDDIYYGNNMIETILYYHTLFPNHILTNSSFIHNNKYYNPSCKDCSIIAGFSGVAYPYKIIKNKNIHSQLENELDNIPKVCYYSDDFVISNILLNNNINILLLGHNNREAYNIKTLNYGLKNDALHKGGVIGNKNEKDVHINNYKLCGKYYNDLGILNKKLNCFLN